MDRNNVRIEKARFKLDELSESRNYEKLLKTTNERAYINDERDSDPLVEEEHLDAHNQMYTSEGEGDLYLKEYISRKPTNSSIVPNKDQILRDTMYQIVVSKNVSDEITESFLKMLADYGIDVPKTKTGLIAEFQRTHESNSQQYAELKLQMAKMEATLEQIKNAILNRKFDIPAAPQLSVNLPIQNEEDLEMLDKQCGEEDMICHFHRCKYLNDVIVDTILLKYNWDGVQGKKKLAQYTNLHRTLYDAFKNETISDFKMYQQFVKAELRRVHNKHHQKLSRKRRSLNNYANSEGTEVSVFSEEILS